MAPFEPPLGDESKPRLDAESALIVPLLVPLLPAAVLYLVVETAYPAAFQTAFWRGLPWAAIPYSLTLPLLRRRWHNFRHTIAPRLFRRDLTALFYWGMATSVVPLAIVATIASGLAVVNGALGTQSTLALSGIIADVDRPLRHGPWITLTTDVGTTLKLRVSDDVSRHAQPGDRYSETVRVGSLGVVYQFAHDGVVRPRNAR